MKWEYMTLKFATTGFWIAGNLNTDEFNQKLNELGEEGWELVSVFDTNQGQGMTRDVIAVFKRNPTELSSSASHGSFSWQ